ncbi:secreted RxLR effector protein 161-like [Apium graveolens]|uniref:secreted RxLR effector protein 161-like n=1 Tax=Apium graveolens TaxID=4045 RepID=UPI003D7A2CB5
MTDLGKLSYYLGIEVKQEAGYIELKQLGYAEKLLKRADIAFSVKIVSRYMERPTALHLNAMKRILRDLGGTIDDRRSKGGMAYYLNESLISWVSQKQRVVALSSCEAEFIAVPTASACQEFG